MTLLAADEARVSDLLRMLAATSGGFREDAVNGQLRDGWSRGALHIAAESSVVEQSLVSVVSTQAILPLLVLAAANCTIYGRIFGTISY